MRKNNFVFKGGKALFKTSFLLGLFLVFGKIINAQDSKTIYQKDFEQYWKIVDESFAYFDTQKTNWKKVKEIYQSEVDKISNRNDFIRLLEKCNLELYNGHVGLNTNLPSSSKLIPSQTDLWAKKIGDRYLIVSVRDGYNAAKVGLKVHMQIIKFNDEPIEMAIQKFFPKSFSDYDDRVYDFALNMLLAGTHDTPRKITVLDKRVEKDFFPDALENKFRQEPERLLNVKILEDNIGYIKINNSLGKKELIAEFDKAMEDLMETNGLILDLRETPGGGNNTVAKAIMGRFTPKEFPYQRYRYVYDERESDVEHVWMELVLPRGKRYQKHGVVLVGRWTGSMGEGMALGFNSMPTNFLTVGTEMAGLLGAIWSYQLDETGIGFQIPGIKLYHINGTPRENFVSFGLLKNNNNVMKEAIETIKSF